MFMDNFAMKMCRVRSEVHTPRPQYSDKCDPNEDRSLGKVRYIL